MGLQSQIYLSNTFPLFLRNARSELSKLIIKYLLVQENVTVSGSAVIKRDGVLVMYGLVLRCA